MHQATEYCNSVDLSFSSTFEYHLLSKQPEPNQEWLINRQHFGQSRFWLSSCIQVTADLSTAAVGGDTHQLPAQADHLPVIVIEGPDLSPLAATQRKIPIRGLA